MGYRFTCHKSQTQHGIRNPPQVIEMDSGVPSLKHRTMFPVLAKPDQHIPELDSNSVNSHALFHPVIARQAHVASEARSMFNVTVSALGSVKCVLHLQTETASPALVHAALTAIPQTEWANSKHGLNKPRLLLFTL